MKLYHKFMKSFYSALIDSLEPENELGVPTYFKYIKAYMYHAERV